MKRVLSGMQPSGKIHLGNYLGALKKWIELQNNYECFYFIADWHALTTCYMEPSKIKEYTIEMVIDWLSCGIDPEKSIIFIQSLISEHAELHIILSMLTPLSWLERNPTYKEKKREIKDKDIGHYGFFGYPVLQAADIMLYKAQFIPVGIDQLPHIEFTRELIRRFNFLYKANFPIPEPILTEVPKLCGTDGRKMSKSYNNCIYLSDSPSLISEKIMKMITDPQRGRRYDPGRPEVCPVYSYHKIFTDSKIISEIDKGCRTAEIGCVDCKRILIKNLLSELEEIISKREELKKKEEFIKEVIFSGTEKAKKIAKANMEQIRDLMGMIKYHEQKASV